MKFVLASYGSRGDVEPLAAVGRELAQRGHEVCMAVPPDLVGLIESAGIEAVAYGPETQVWIAAYRDFCTAFLGKFWRIKDLIRSWPELRVSQYWVDVTAALKTLADGADLLSTGGAFEEPAANVAEYHGIPLATLHHFPIRANGQLISILPSPVGRVSMRLYEWLMWRRDRKRDDEQRRKLGLEATTGPPAQRIADRGSLEIQAYDQVYFPGLAAEWAKWKDNRPFVGTLTMGLLTDADDEVGSWITAGTPPICFGFGSLPIEFPKGTIEMIASACAQLGERALICSGGTDFGGVPHFDHVQVVGTVNYASIFPSCRAAVHHGGSGTTAASLRAGIPTLILWTGLDQAFWGSRIKRLKVGTARRFSTTTRKLLVRDLRRILAPDYAIRAREFATLTTEPAESIANAANLMENFVRFPSSG